MYTCAVNTNHYCCNLQLSVSEYVEELDYNEDMDNLDVHPTGILEEEEDGKLMLNCSGH